MNSKIFYDTLYETKVAIELNKVFKIQIES